MHIRDYDRNIKQPLKRKRRDYDYDNSCKKNEYKNIKLLFVLVHLQNGHRKDNSKQKQAGNDIAACCIQRCKKTMFCYFAAHGKD